MTTVRVIVLEGGTGTGRAFVPRARIILPAGCRQSIVNDKRTELLRHPHVEAVATWVDVIAEQVDTDDGIAYSLPPLWKQNPPARSIQQA